MMLAHVAASLGILIEAESATSTFHHLTSNTSAIQVWLGLLETSWQYNIFTGITMREGTTNPF